MNYKKILGGLLVFTLSTGICFIRNAAYAQEIETDAVLREDGLFYKDDVPVNGLLCHDSKFYYQAEKGFIKRQWYSVNGDRYYFTANGSAMTGFDINSRKSYYFNEKGIFQQGLIRVGGKTYFQNAEGLIKSTWKTIDGNRYYFTSDGSAMTGFDINSRKSYYFNEDGVFQQGLINAGGKTYFQNAKGLIKSTWKTVDGNRYYFTSNGSAMTGFDINSRKSYYFNEDGVFLQGLIKTGGKTYFQDADGLSKSTWKTVNGKRYYFTSDGSAMTGFDRSKNYTYYFDENGVLSIGWKEINGNKYYFSKEGYMYTGTHKIDGTSYVFGKDGHLINGWKLKNGHWYFYINNTTYATGWTKIEGKKYYFNPKGHRVGNGPVKKVIDISEHNKTIDWDTVKKQGDVDMVILRLGYGSELSQEDKQFARNVKELKRLNIPFAVYLYSYSENKSDAIAEAQNVHNILSKYGISKNTEVYYDLEHFTIGGQYIDVSKKQYEQIVTGFMQKIHSLGYKNAYVYSYKSYLESVLNSPIILPYVKWVALYNDECTYTGTSYWGWQYTSDGSIPGISGRVDINGWMK